MSYSAFWTVRLWCVALIPLIYFRDGASPAATRNFFRATVIGVAPVLAIQWIGLLSTGFADDGRVYALWVGAVWPSILAFSLAAGCVVRLSHKPSAGMACLTLIALASGVIGGSKTGAIGFALSVGAAMAFNIRRIFTPSVLLALVALAALVAVALPRDVGLLGHVQYYNETGTDTAGDRVHLWSSIVIPRILESPLTGSGFAANAVERMTSQDMGWDAGHAHNGALNSLSEVGLIGSLPLFLLIWNALARLGGQPRRLLTHREIGPLAASWICLLVAGSVELTFGGSLQPPVYLFYALLIAMDAAMLRDRPAPAGESAQRFPAFAPAGRSLEMGGAPLPS
jgi:O-antigen ligase